MSTSQPATVPNGPIPASVSALPGSTSKYRFRGHPNLFVFVWTFAIEFVFNLLLVVVVYSIGFTTGYVGTPNFNLDQIGKTIGETISTLFGGAASFLALIGGIAIFVCTLWGVYELSKRAKHALVVLAFVVGVVAGGWLIWRVVEWENVGIGFTPILAILAFTVFETITTALIVRYIVSRASTLSKGNNNP